MAHNAIVSILIDYDRPDSSTYRKTILYDYRDSSQFVWDSGDPIEDYNAALKYARSLNVDIQLRDDTQMFPLDSNDLYAFDINWALTLKVYYYVSD